MEKKELARAYFLKGYNCAQSVLAAFADEIGLSEREALSFSVMFGGGVVGRRELCGAVSASLLVLGVAGGIAPEEKADAYRMGCDFIRDFEEKFTSSECKTLLTSAKATFAADPAARTDEYYKTRPCLVFVEAAAEMLMARLGAKEKS